VWLDRTMYNLKIKGSDLARQIRVHESQISRWRSGHGVPSMKACMRLAQVLGIDPLRLAATAGHLDGEVGGIKPLPVPEATRQREHIREQIAMIKGLTEKSRSRLIEVYEEEIGKEDYS
jgi:transcriptional regulator with XRE-family HTH domain